MPTATEPSRNQFIVSSSVTMVTSHSWNRCIRKSSSINVLSAVFALGIVLPYLTSTAPNHCFVWDKRLCLKLDHRLFITGQRGHCTMAPGWPQQSWVQKAFVHNTVAFLGVWKGATGHRVSSLQNPSTYQQCQWSCLGGLDCLMSSTKAVWPRRKVSGIVQLSGDCLFQREVIPQRSNERYILIIHDLAWLVPFGATYSGPFIPMGQLLSWDTWTPSHHPCKLDIGRKVCLLGACSSHLFLFQPSVITLGQYLLETGILGNSEC